MKYRSLAVNMVVNTGRFIIFSVITNIYDKKTKGPTLIEFFTATSTGKDTPNRAASAV
jgi:hypothetical protein